MPSLLYRSNHRRPSSSNDDYCAHFFLQCLATVAAVAVAAAAIVSVATLISVAPPVGILLLAMCCWFYLAFTCNENNGNTEGRSPQASTFFIVNPTGSGHMGYFSQGPASAYTYATRTSDADNLQ